MMGTEGCLDQKNHEEAVFVILLEVAHGTVICAPGILNDHCKQMPSTLCQALSREIVKDKVRQVDHLVWTHLEFDRKGSCEFL